MLERDVREHDDRGARGRWSRRGARPGPPRRRRRPLPRPRTRRARPRSAPRTASRPAARPSGRTRASAASRSASSPPTRMRSAQPRRRAATCRRPARRPSARSSASAARAVVVLPFVPTTWIAPEAALGIAERRRSSRIRPSPNSSGQGLSASSQATLSAAEGIELAPVARQLLALALDHLGRRVGDEVVVRRASPRSARSPCAAARSPPSRLPFRGSCSSRTTASKMRRSSSVELDDARRCAGRSRPRPGRARARRRPRRSGRPAPATARRSGALSRSGSCVQISSVTCGITGCRSASRRSSAASAVAAASASPS